MHGRLHSMMEGTQPCPVRFVPGSCWQFPWSAYDIHDPSGLEAPRLRSELLLDLPSMPGVPDAALAEPPRSDTPKRLLTYTGASVPLR